MCIERKLRCKHECAMLITLCLFFHSNASNVHVVRASNHTSRVRQSVRPSVRPTPDALSLLALADDFHPAAAVQRRPLQAPHSSSIEPRCCDQTVAPRVVPGLPISSHTGACPLIICVSTFGPDNWSTAARPEGCFGCLWSSKEPITRQRVNHSTATGLSLSETTLARFVWRAWSSASTPDRTYMSSTFSRARRRRGRSARV